MPDMFYNDGGIVRKIRKLFYNDSGIVREIKKAWYCDGDVWRLVFDSVVAPPPPVDPPGDGGGGTDPDEFTVSQAYSSSGPQATLGGGVFNVAAFGYSEHRQPIAGSINPDRFNGGRILVTEFVSTSPTPADEPFENNIFSFVIEGEDHGSLKITPQGGSSMTLAPSSLGSGISYYSTTIIRPAIWDGSGNVTLTIEQV